MHEQGFKASSTRDAIRTYAQEKKGFSDETSLHSPHQMPIA